MRHMTYRKPPHCDHFTEIEADIAEAGDELISSAWLQAYGRNRERFLREGRACYRAEKSASQSQPPAPWAGRRRRR